MYREIKVYVCTRCNRPAEDIPDNEGNMLSDDSLATVSITEGIMYVVPHVPGCQMTRDGLVRKIV